MAEVKTPTADSKHEKKRKAHMADPLGPAATDVPHAETNGDAHAKSKETAAAPPPPQPSAPTEPVQSSLVEPLDPPPRSTEQPTLKRKASELEYTIVDEEEASDAKRHRFETPHYTIVFE